MNKVGQNFETRMQKKEKNKDDFDEIVNKFKEF
jgi:hypothetical protein